MKTIYFVVAFEKLGQHDEIPLCAFHSLDDGETLSTIKDSETVGLTPADFGDDRSFWIVKSLKK
jgi:hypothetical protein